MMMKSVGSPYLILDWLLRLAIRPNDLQSKDHCVDDVQRRMIACDMNNVVDRLVS